MHSDIWQQDGGRRVLWGCSIGSASPRMAELAARVGFDVVWIEMEHAGVDLAGAETMCVAAESAGAAPLIRATGYRREHILHALEIGGRLIVAPQVNDDAAAREMVEYGKFPPLGRRGYNSRSRAAEYGAVPFDMARMNGENWLLPQIETKKAVENLNRILAVPGIAGIFIGPGDLSVDMGQSGKLDAPEVIETTARCIAEARSAGLHAGILCPSGSALLEAALAAGADLAIVGSDIAATIGVWREQLAKCRQAKSGTGNRRV